LRLRREKQIFVSTRKTSVSVIIPFKNEVSNLPLIFNSLKSQNYPSELCEIIFVDDYSSDDGFKHITELIKKDGLFKLVKNEFEQGKKYALEYGIQRAKNDLILTSDADCTFGENWIDSMVAVLESKNAHLVVGPVKLETDLSLIGSLIQLEFSALIASTSGAIGIGKAFMCNGANLAFSKKLFLDLNPFNTNSKHASGDDVFLLHKIKSVFSKSASIHFANHSNALVSSKTAIDFKQFIHQRLRWAGKSVSYKDGFSIFVGFIVFLTNLALLLSLITWLLGFISASMFLVFFLVKWLIDYLLLNSVETWIRPKKSFFYSFLLSFFYPFYIVSIALLSLLIQPEWKGRKI
tara:strand:- start:16420 stop:17469 length:1050 start_codon:yes stop_codon:yes gene_type:complete